MDTSKVKGTPPFV